MKYRKTKCSDPKHLKLFGYLWGYHPVDMRKKYFICIHCKKPHLIKDDVVKDG